MKTLLHAALLLLLGASAGAVEIAPGNASGTGGSAGAEVHFDDLDAILKRRTLRAAVAWSRTDYYLERGKPLGMAAEAIRELESYLNRRYPRRLFRLHVVAMPVNRGELIGMLERGEADIAVAGITVTPERAARIDFTRPVYSGVREVVVSYRATPLLPDRAALAGEQLFVRASSSYAQSIRQLAAELVGAGLPPVQARLADEHLDDEDILEMVNAGIVERTVVDDYKATLWQAWLPDIRTEPVALREGGDLAWGVRKQTPRLQAVLDDFVRTHRIGTTFGNVLAQRYYGANSRVGRPLSAAERERYEAVIGLFRKYGEQYGFDPLLLTAQAFQESGLDQRARSSEGAIGIMQVLPRTGRSMKVGDIRQLEPNVHAGVKYLRELADTYFADPAIDPWDRTLLVFAAYNAGPTSIRRMQRLARARGLDPHRWFDHVERVTLEKIGRQPVDYVANIGKYYVAYRRIEEQRALREAARGAL